MDLDDLLRRGCGNVFDLHASRRRKDQHQAPCFAVERDPEVHLALNLSRFFAPDFVHGVAADVHAQNRLGGGVRFFAALCQPDAARLAAPSNWHLCLDRHRAELIERRDGLAGSARQPAPLAGNPRFLELLLGLVLQQLHKGMLPCLRRGRRTRLSCSIVSAEISRGLVCCGSMMSSM